MNEWETEIKKASTILTHQVSEEVKTPQTPPPVDQKERATKSTLESFQPIEEEVIKSSSPPKKHQPDEHELKDPASASFSSSSSSSHSGNRSLNHDTSGKTISDSESRYFKKFGLNPPEYVEENNFSSSAPLLEEEHIIKQNTSKKNRKKESEECCSCTLV